MLKTTTKPTPDKDARRFAIWVTNDMIERQAIPISDDVPEEERYMYRGNKAPFLEFHLYVLAKRDNFEWTGDTGGDNKLMLSGKFAAYDLPGWTEKIYDEYWHKLLEDDNGTPAAEQRMDNGGRRDGVAGNQEQKHDDKDTPKGAEVQSGHDSESDVPGRRRSEVSRRPEAAVSRRR